MTIAGLLAPCVASAEEMKWKIDGVERRALVFAPTAKTTDGRAPLIFAFHGHGGNMEEFSHTVNIQGAWPQAVVVYMQGLATSSRRDPRGMLAGWQHNEGDAEDRDLKFLDTSLATLLKKFSVNEKMIYSMGFSDGSLFTFLLWNARPNVFAAFGIVGGVIFPGVHIAEPKPVIHVAGEADETVKFVSQKATIEVERRVNSATGDGTPCGAGCTMYSSAKSAPVETVFHNGGHVYPPFVTANIAEFFKAQTLRN
jgi:polyhydroxybutyrate depolymerase